MAKRSRKRRLSLRGLEAQLTREFPEEGRKCDAAMDKLLADMKKTPSGTGER